IFGRLGIDRKSDRFTSGVHEQLVGILWRPQWLSVNRDKIIAFSDLDAGFGQRRTQLGIPIFPRIDFLDAVPAAGLVELIIHTEQAHVYGMKIGIVTAANVSVGI